MNGYLKDMGHFLHMSHFFAHGVTFFAHYCIINIFIFILIFVFCGMSFWQIIRAYTSLKSKVKYDFTEYFVGLKSNTTSRLYIFMFLSIRILSWFIVAMLPNINLTMKIFALTILQATSATYLLAVRPYEYVINTISESINQICISFWICVLIYFNTLERWSLFINWMLILIIIFSIAIQVLISLVDLFIQIVKRLKRCFWESKKHKEVKEKNDFSSLQNESDISGINPTSINLQSVKDKYNKKSQNTYTTSEKMGLIKIINVYFIYLKQVIIIILC